VVPGNASGSQATCSQLPPVREGHVAALCDLQRQAFEALNRGLARVSGFEIDEEHGLGSVDRLGMTIEEQIAKGDPQGVVAAVRSAAVSLTYIASRMAIVERFVERDRRGVA
jgi:hypothetical protein